MAYAISSQNKIARSIDLRLYTLNCGYFVIHDAAPFFNENFYPHRSLRLADPCYLIKHDNVWMLWDLGLGDRYAGKSVEDKKHGITIYVNQRLTTQLKELGLTPSRIKYVALSHSHFDHTGNADLFSNATWILQNAEYQFIQKAPLSSAVDANIVKLLVSRKKALINGDYDIFHDGTVKIISTPGHTPGHESLQVNLPHAGTIILSGDLYHTRLSYQHQQIPVFNTSHIQTLTSMARLNRILQNTTGRLVIQHDPQDFMSLPKIPNYLD